MKWTHGHTFLGGVVAGVAVASRWYILLAIVAAGAALGCGLVLVAVAVGHRVADRLERRVLRRRGWSR